MIAMPIPASPQNSSSIAIGIESPVGSLNIASAMNSQPYRPISRRLLDDRIRELLLLVPLFSGGANHFFGEAVHPLLEGQLVFVEGHRKFAHDSKLPVSNRHCLPGGNFATESSRTEPLGHGPM